MSHPLVWPLSQAAGYTLDFIGEISTSNRLKCSWSAPLTHAGTHMMRSPFVLLALALGTWPPSLLGQELKPTGINGFRGPNGNGNWPGDCGAMPADGKSALWRKKTEGTGWAAPVSGGGKVFLLTANSAKISKPADFSKGTREMGITGFLGTAKPPKETYTWALTALDKGTGNSLWTTKIHEGAPQIPHHPSNTYATETPATDGTTICCWVGSCGQLVCLGAEKGNILWRKNLEVEPRATGFGTGSSPIMDSDRVYIQCDAEKNSFVAAYDLKTGAEIWRQPRKVKTSWSTPVLWKNNKRTELVLCGDGLIASYEPATGKEIWRYSGIKGGFATSPAMDKELLIACKSDPFNPGQYVAIRAGHEGDLTLKASETGSPAIAWVKKEKGPGLGSPVLSQGRLFVSSDQFLTCMDASTGNQLWKERLPGAKSVAASVWAQGDSVFVLDEGGNLFRVANTSTFKLLSKSAFGDLHWSTPDLGTGSLVLRGVDEVVRLAGEGK